MTGNQIIITVCVVYFAVMVLIGVIAAKRNKKTSDFLVAGRGLNVPMTAVTLAAVQIGVGIVLSSATNGYNGGVWPGVYYAIGCGGGLIVAGLLAVKKLREQEGYVPLDYFAERYGEENIISAVVHIDETTPHLHLNLIPIADGRLCAKTLFDRKELQNLQGRMNAIIWYSGRGKS